METDDRSAPVEHRRVTRASASSPPVAPRAGTGAVMRVNRFSVPDTVREFASRRDAGGGDDDDPWGFLGPIPGP